MSGDNGSNIYLLLGTEPSRGWKTFTAEICRRVARRATSAASSSSARCSPMFRTPGPISIFVTSENAAVREQLGVERSTLRGPGRHPLGARGRGRGGGIPTVSIWASVPHYVHNAPSPKATLALIDKLEELIDVVDPARRPGRTRRRRGRAGIDALAGDDDDMAAYIAQLEQARDTVDSPEASGEAIAAGVRALPAQARRR